MEQENIRQAALDEALVSINDQVKIGSCNMRIDPNKNKKEATYQVAQDILKLSSYYNAFLITTDASTIKWSCGSLMTEKTASDEESDEEEERLIQRRPTGVVIEVLNEPKGKSTGSSEEAGNIPEVLDKPKGKSAFHVDDDD
ncbi:hypothetical protein Tco_0515383 [Tanacetum coccineum]